MQLKNNIFRKLPLLATVGLLFGLTSCGSYQYVGGSNDGIYSTNPTPVNTAATPVEDVDTSKNDYYNNYFKNKSLEYQDTNNNQEIFTDIDSYRSPQVDNTSANVAYNGQEGWGQSSENVIVNVQPNDFNNFGWNAPFLGFNSFGFGGFNNFGFGGFNHFGFGGFNNFGFIDPFFGGFYGRAGFYNPYRFRGAFGFNNFYGHNRFFNRNRRVFYGNNLRNDAIQRRSNVSRRVVSPNSRYGTTARRSSTTSRNGNNTVRRSTSSRTVDNNATRRSTNSRVTTRPETTTSRRSSSSRIANPNTVNRTNRTTTRRSTSSSRPSYSTGRSSSSNYSSPSRSNSSYSGRSSSGYSRSSGYGRRSR